ncbi:putative ribonuclease H-like domain-containing protein [Tanacetum coccineum]
MNKESSTDDSTLNDRFTPTDGMHVVPPPMTGNYMPSGPNVEIDESQFPYGPKQPQSSESKTRTSDFDSFVLTRSRKIAINTARTSGTNHVNTARQNVSTARQNSSRQSVPTRTARKVSTESTKVNDIRPKPAFHNNHSPTKRPLSKTAALKDKFSNSKVSTAKDKAVSAVEGIVKTVVKASACCIWRPKQYFDDPQRALKNKGIVDSGCSRHMTGNKSYLVDYQDFNGGPVAFRGSKGKITRKGKIGTGKLDFDDVCFVQELQQFNLFSVSQMCDKKNKVLFTDTECLVLSPDFKLPDENQVLLRVPRQHNMYSFNLENFIPCEELTCLIAKATTDESNKWHRRLGHVNFKNLNKLVKGNLVRGLPSKIFQNDHTCVACQQGKQHKASCKAKVVSFISQPLQLLHMDLFRPTSIRSINHKTYCLVLTDDFSRFSWVFFLRTKDETSGILKDFIRQIENQLNKKVKIIRYDNGTEFKNREMIEFCKFEEKADEGFLVGYSLNSKAFRHVTAANRANKTACLEEANPNAGTQDQFVVGNSELNDESAQEHCVLPIWSSYTSTTKGSEVMSEGEKPINDAGSKPNKEPKEHVDQVFLDELEQLQRQEKEANDAAETLRKEFARSTEDLLLQAGVAKATSTNPVSTDRPSVSTDSPSVITDSPRVSTDASHPDQDDSQIPALEDMYDSPSSGIFTKASYDDEGAVPDFTNLKSVVNVSPIPTSRIHTIHPTTQILGDPTLAVQTRSKVSKSSGSHAFVSYIQKKRRNNHKDFQHCLFACFLSQVEPKKISNALEDESWVDAMQEELLQFKIKKVWILVDFPKGKKTIGLKWVYRNKKDKRGVVVRNKARLVAQGHRQEEGIDYDEVFAPVVRIEAIRIFLAFASYMGFIVYQMDVKSAFLYGIIDEEVYVTQPPGFINPMYPKKVYKVNGYRRGAIDKTLFIKKDKKDIILVQVYVDDIIFGSTKKSWCDEFEALMKSKFQMSSMGELTFFLGLQVKQKEDGIFISQGKYVAEILKKFDFMNVKTTSTPIETQRPLTKDEEATYVDVHLYRSMIGSLMYLTASRPDIMFAVCNCSRFQVTPKTSYLNVVKRIFRYLKGKPKLGLWYPRVSPFYLEAYSDSDYAGANLERKPTTGGCQFLSRRLISWQCKKQTIVATSTTEAEYVAAASYYRQVLWIQNQMLDYGFNFMNTKIHINNESKICIVKNPVFHSKTKHIKIRHHFIRDAFEKKFIQVLKIHTDNNVADLLTKAVDAGSPNLLSPTIIQSATMTALESCPKHNMIAYLEKTERNTEFHEVIDFLKRSSIHYALTVSPVVSTTFVKQFWMTATSKTINNVRYINAKIAGKPVTISEASIRSSLLFNDADGIDSLNNQAIFDAI